MTSNERTTRPPIVAVMGHIDHGKSTLLDTIRTTKVTETEAGGITQHISAYEIETTSSEGKQLTMTFLDTPGHAAFANVRARGVTIADIVVLVVAADDGIQPQTKEAIDVIREHKLPFVVAINKIDKSNANVEKTKQSLLEYEVYLEQYSGSVPAVEISATEGRGIDDLLDMIGLVAELEELTGDPSAAGEGYVLESGRDPKRGIEATLIITNGTLSKGEVVSSGNCLAPVRIMEDFQGNTIEQATFSSPVNIVGWSDLPKPGDRWNTYENKRSAEKAMQDTEKRTSQAETLGEAEDDVEQAVIPIIIKTDSQGGIEGIRHEIEKLVDEHVAVQILTADVGTINENDIQLAASTENALVVGFNVDTDTAAQALAQRENVEIGVFTIIYDAANWLADIIKERTPTIKEKEVTGQAKIIKRFSESKRRQVLGAKVQSGTIKRKETVRILRRDAEIGTGTVTNLQHQKEDVGRVEEGMEFGVEIEAKPEIQPGDLIEAFDIVKK